MGDGTSVANEASAMTILDNSFSSITRAVMWGRSLYLNIQRFILFQMTINVVACLVVMIGAVIGTESPLTVTQMLWVNLIMDTFAALALASLPPDESVMKEKPRSRKSYIITREMGYRILGTGIAFVLFLFGFLQYFKHAELTNLRDFSWETYFGGYFDFGFTRDSLSEYELSVFFTIFVMLQFWNMFNAKSYHTGGSAFRSMFNKSTILGFGLVSLVIVCGQFLIVTFGGEMFSVAPLHWSDWAIIIIGTSPVLLIGELLHFASLGIKRIRKR